MTAHEALQAIVDGTIEDIKYSPVDRIKAIALLHEFEQREINPSRGSGFYETLERIANQIESDEVSD